MGMKLQSVTITLAQHSSGEPTVTLLVGPTGYDTGPTGNLKFNQFLIDDLKAVAKSLQRAVDDA